MPAATNLLLGTLLGQLVSLARVDYVYYPHFISNLPVSSLKSVVTASQRSEAEAFYKAFGNSPPNFQYFNMVTSAIILLSLVGQVVQGRKRILNLISTALFTAAIAVHVFLGYPFLQEILSGKSRKVNDTLLVLSSIAFSNAITTILIGLTTIIQVSNDEADEEEAVVVKKSKKSSKKD